MARRLMPGEKPAFPIKIVTSARLTYRAAREDVLELLRIHDASTKRSRGRPDPRLEVFKRAGVILTITAWETFIEDTLRNNSEWAVSEAEDPRAVSGAFLSVAHTWLSRKPSPEEVMKWTGIGWKHFVVDQLHEELGRLDTPNTENVSRFSKKCLGFDLTKHWRWKGTSHAMACKRLDALLDLRGSLVHRAKEFFELKARVKRSDVEDGLALVDRLVECTERAIRTNC